MAADDVRDEPVDPEDQEWVDLLVNAPPGIALIHVFPENARAEAAERGQS